MSQTPQIDVSTYEQAADERLMALYINGDDRAFQELFSRYKGRVFGYLTKRLTDPRVAEDLFQAVFLNLHRSRSRYNPERPFSAWLFSISRNVVRDHLRSQKRTVVAPLAEGNFEETSGQPLDDSSAQTRLEEALQQMTPMEREAIRLRYDKAFKFEDIARELNTSAGNARQLISRAVRKVRGILK